VRRRGSVAVGAKKRRGRREDGEAEENVDSHSFAPKAGEVTGTFPEAVVLRKVRPFSASCYMLLAKCKHAIVYYKNEIKLEIVG
jgi:hypothetical protein